MITVPLTWQNRLAKLVAVIRGSITGLDRHLQWWCKAGRILPTISWTLPGENVTWSRWEWLAYQPISNPQRKKLLVYFCRPGMCRLPKQYPAVPAMTWAPFPALCTSLIRPPVPVVAPLNGATPKPVMDKWIIPAKENTQGNKCLSCWPVGKLCVSAVKITCLSVRLVS